MPKSFAVPEDFGAIGDGVTNDAVALQNFLNAIANNVGYLNSKTYATSASLTISAPTELLGAGSSALKAIGAASINVLSVSGTGLGFTTSLQADAAMYAKQLTVSDASGFAVDDFIYVRKGVPDAFVQLSQIESISGNTLTIAIPLYFPIATAELHAVQKWVPLRNVILKNFRIIGNTAVNTRGIFAEHLIESRVEDLVIENTPQAGLWLNVGLYNTARRVMVIKCGSTVQSDIFLLRQTESIFDSLVSRRSTGFGPQLSLCNGCVVGSIIQEAAVNRGVKVNASSHNCFAQIISNLSGSTGIAISGASYRNQLGQAIALANGEPAALDNQIGLWFSGEGSDANVIEQIIALANVKKDIQLNNNDDMNNILDSLFDSAKFDDFGQQNVVLLNTVGRLFFARGSH